jgi:hypothetical protein
MLRSQQRQGAHRSGHQREQHRPIPTGLFRLVSQLIHRKFWFLGLFLWACWYWPLSIASLSDWSLLVLESGPFEFGDVLIRP